MELLYVSLGPLVSPLNDALCKVGFNVCGNLALRVVVFLLIALMLPFSIVVPQLRASFAIPMLKHQSVQPHKHV